jgi:hypothetical protein
VIGTHHVTAEQKVELAYAGHVPWSYQTAAGQTSPGTNRVRRTHGRTPPIGCFNAWPWLPEPYAGRPRPATDIPPELGPGANCRARQRPRLWRSRPEIPPIPEGPGGRERRTNGDD